MFRKLVKICFIVAGLLLIALSVGVFYFGMNPAVKSEFSNCMIVNKTSAYIGKRLKNSELEKGSRITTEQCQLRDVEIDKGDGAKKGRVRWAECAVGPDCDEAGMF